MGTLQQVKIVNIVTYVELICLVTDKFHKLCELHILVVLCSMMCIEYVHALISVAMIL